MFVHAINFCNFFLNFHQRPIFTTSLKRMLIADVRSYLTLCIQIVLLPVQRSSFRDLKHKVLFQLAGQIKPLYCFTSLNSLGRNSCILKSTGYTFMTWQNRKPTSLRWYKVLSKRGDLSVMECSVRNHQIVGLNFVLCVLE